MSAARWAASLVAGLVAVGVVVALVRGGTVDDEQAASYRRAADALCTQADALITAAYPPRPAKITEYGQWVRLAVPAVEDFDRSLHGLHPSEDQRSDHRELLQATELQRQALKRARYQIMMGELSDAETSVASFDSAGSSFETAARRLHLEECAKEHRQGPSDQSRLEQIDAIRRRVQPRLSTGHIGPVPRLAPNRTHERRGAELPGAYLYLVPIDGVSVSRIKKLAQDLSVYLKYSGFRWRVVPRMRTEIPDYDVGRQQIDGVADLDRLVRRYPFQAGSRAVAVIGVTDVDLYWRETSDAYVLALRDLRRDGLGGWGIISTARLDPRNYGLLPDEDLFRLRLKKLAARYVGMFMFGVNRFSDRPHSLFRPTVPSVEAVDTMTDRFCEDRPFPIASGAC